MIDYDHDTHSHPVTRSLVLAVNTARHISVKLSRSHPIKQIRTINDSRSSRTTIAAKKHHSSDHGHSSSCFSYKQVIDITAHGRSLKSTCRLAKLKSIQSAPSGLDWSMAPQLHPGHRDFSARDPTSLVISVTIGEGLLRLPLKKSR